MPTYSNTQFNQVILNSLSATSTSSNTLNVAGNQFQVDAGGSLTAGKIGIFSVGVLGSVTGVNVKCSSLSSTIANFDSSVALTASTTAVNTNKMQIPNSDGGYTPDFINAPVLYVKNNRLIIYFQSGLSTYYYYLNLGTEDATWVFSSSEP